LPLLVFDYGIHLVLSVSLVVFLLFFFQAEDGIRDRNVTGVQTCALPISSGAVVTSQPSAASRSAIARVMVSSSSITTTRAGAVSGAAFLSGSDMAPL